MPLEGPPMWHKANPTGTPPSTRSGQSVIYDALRDRMLMFGGIGGDTTLYQLSLAGDMAWSTVSISGSPPAARRNAAVAYDPVRDRMLIFGGQRWPDDFVLNEVWVLSLSGTPAWTQILPPAPYPNPRDD